MGAHQPVEDVSHLHPGEAGGPDLWPAVRPSWTAKGSRGRTEPKAPWSPGPWDTAGCGSATAEWVTLVPLGHPGPGCPPLSGGAPGGPCLGASVSQAIAPHGAQIRCREGDTEQGDCNKGGPQAPCPFFGLKTLWVWKVLASVPTAAEGGVSAAHHPRPGHARPKGPGCSRWMSGASVASKKSSSRSSSEYLVSERCSAWPSTACSRSTLRRARHTPCSRSASSCPRMARLRWALPARDTASTCTSYTAPPPWPRCDRRRAGDGFWVHPERRSSRSCRAERLGQRKPPRWAPTCRGPALGTTPGWGPPGGGSATPPTSFDSLGVPAGATSE